MSLADSILWFRNDLRLTDNPALNAALATGRILPVYIWAPEEEGEWPPGGASKWWLHQSLRALQSSLQERGSKLILLKGPSLEVLDRLLHATGARTLLFNNRYEPAVLKRDREIATHLQNAGFTIRSFNSLLLFEPWDIANKSGSAFRVFTPYWKTCVSLLRIEPPTAAPRTIRGPDQWPASLRLEELELPPKIDWPGGLRDSWTPGEAGASVQLARFLKEGLQGYEQGRDQPGIVGTSRLSPHLHFGEIGPRQICHALEQIKKRGFALTAAEHARYLAELGWREFGYHLLYHLPSTPTDPLRPEFARFSWRNDPLMFKAWQLGKTGYPIVDAGMRELWHTGWMHNRVRMIVASFLTKDLLLPWQKGARWFWDTLVDADLASNTLGWQWTAGCGADAMPYFRIFNPVSQGEKFDPFAKYVRRWVPELSQLPDKWIHQPWRAPELLLSAAGVKLGVTYPDRIISHEIARNVALEAFQKIRKAEDNSE